MLIDMWYISLLQVESLTMLFILFLYFCSYDSFSSSSVLENVFQDVYDIVF
jgi:hypothetical protein